MKMGVKPMFTDPGGPIEQYSWGKFVIRGEEHSGKDESRIGKGKDIKIIKGVVKRWKERKGHVLDRSMVEDMLAKDVRVLVVGNGADGALFVPQEVLEYLLGNGIEKVIVKKTPEACREYNRLYHEGEKVALLAHGTC